MTRKDIHIKKLPKKKIHGLPQSVLQFFPKPRRVAPPIPTPWTKPTALSPEKDNGPKKTCSAVSGNIWQ